MRWTSDDFDGGTMGVDVASIDYPADIEVMGYFTDPLIAAELDEMITDAELMGIDFDDPELMGAFFKNLIGKIKSRIQARKAKKAAGGAPADSGFPTLSVQTGQGSASLGPGGITWTGPQAAAAAPAPAAGGMGNIQEMLKNPLVLAGIGGGVLLLIMMMKKKKQGA